MSLNNPPRILVIEDNETNRELMVYLLRAFGYRTLEACDGENGIECARREHPDMIVCDIHLPKLDGYGVNRHLKIDTALRDIPVVAVTALAMVGDRDGILASGFNGYVSKPIDPETFVQDVEKFLPVDRRAKVVRRAPSRLATHQAKPISTSEKRATILIVDDTLANIEFVRSTLEPSGYRVLAAASVKEAIDALKKARTDLVLCDLDMARESGLDLLDRAKTEPALRAIPIVIISSTATGHCDRMECFERGATNFIKRPIEPEALLAEIDNILSMSGGRAL